MDLVILDRDGVINHDSDAFIKTPEEWNPIPGSLEAIARLSQAGRRVVVASNQSGIGRRLFNIEDLNRIHTKMQLQLGELGGRIEAIFFCPHRPTDDCACRKPKPGLLLDIASRLAVSLEGVPMVGDSHRDIRAARKVKGRPILVLTGNGKHALEHELDVSGVEVYEDLGAAAEALLAEDAIRAESGAT